MSQSIIHICRLFRRWTTQPTGHFHVPKREWHHADDAMFAFLFTPILYRVMTWHSVETWFNFVLAERFPNGTQLKRKKVYNINKVLPTRTKPIKTKACFEHSLGWKLNYSTAWKTQWSWRLTQLHWHQVNMTFSMGLVAWDKLDWLIDWIYIYRENLIIICTLV